MGSSIRIRVVGETGLYPRARLNSHNRLSREPLHISGCQSDATLSREPFAQQPERYKGGRSSRHDSFPGLAPRPPSPPQNGSDVRSDGPDDFTGIGAGDVGEERTAVRQIWAMPPSTK